MVILLPALPQPFTYSLAFPILIPLEKHSSHLYCQSRFRTSSQSVNALIIQQLRNGMNSMEEMRIKGDAPLFSRPASPEREKKYVRTLADIPEATPGPNAFAQQAARMDKHRLDGNAFYQQEVLKRTATPPTTTHPALRPRSHSDPPTPPRESSCTTMSPFINVGIEQKQESPPLKLVPSDADLAVPTLRGVIGERQEQTHYERNGNPMERTPVFIPTPKIACSDFAEPAATPKKRVEKEATQADSLSKTPKKGFFGRLKLTTSLRGAPSPSTSTLGSDTKAEYDENMPVKAQAVLGTSPSKCKGRASLSSSPSKPSLPRSPSKRKGFFSRKNSGFANINDSTTSILHKSTEIEQIPLTANSINKTPQTAISDPTHYSYYNKRIISQSHSDRGGEKEKHPNQCAIVRSQSLKYFDHSIPPTPPAKNTPPDEKARKEAELAKKSSRLPFQDEQTTPSKQPEGLVSSSGRLSPTRFGSYGHKEIPTLVTKPSVYSLHASVVPSMTEANTLEEMKARIDGLGLEGFNMPPGDVRGSKICQMHSPSIYSTDWNDRPNTVLIDGTPQMEHAAKSPNCQSTHTKESSSTGGEIPIFYPELAKDPSLNNMTAFLSLPSHKRAQSDTPLSERHPWHGCTHSLDHSNSNSPRPSHSSAIFAHHIDDDLKEKKYDSPTSFNHPSAAPSPLHLPTAVYTPPPRTTSKLDVGTKLETSTSAINNSATKGAEIQDHANYASSAPRHNNVFDNAPSLSARTSYNKSRTPSPQNSGAGRNLGPECDVDPQKPSPKKSHSTDKLDRMIEILNTLNARNDEINTMRDEMRATNERLDQRLAAVEHLSRASPAPSYAVDEGLSNEKAEKDASGSRIPTDVAHDFYRRHGDSESSISENASASIPTDSDTIAELKETNRRLLEMVGGFADKIQALERKTGGQF